MGIIRRRMQSCRINSEVNIVPVHYLTFTNVGDASASISWKNGSTSCILYSSYDHDTWEYWNRNTSLAPGEVLYICGKCPSGLDSSSFVIKNCSIECQGNVMSLVDYENILTTIPVNYCFRELFSGCSGLVTAPELPATTMAYGCYNAMFKNCTALIAAPTLPATTLARFCYHSMFYGCTTISVPPSLPCMTLATGCYARMFENCTNLSTAPSLPAETLPNTFENTGYGVRMDGCYAAMFRGCSSLITAPVLPALSIPCGSYAHMFENCTNLINAPSLPATNLPAMDTSRATVTGGFSDNYGGCYEAMFKNCTSLEIPPALPAETLSDCCYRQMFMGCTNLTSAPALPATAIPNTITYTYAYGAEYGAYESMFEGCTSLTTAPDLPATGIGRHCYNYMFRNCVSLNYIKAMLTRTSPGTTFTKNWVSGVSSVGTFVKNASATWNVTGVDGIPDGWTVQTASS